jgi:hypothetical protein
LFPKACLFSKYALCPLCNKPLLTFQHTNFVHTFDKVKALSLWGLAGACCGLESGHDAAADDDDSS